MTDLLATAPFPYIRMSATDKCRHAIGHMIIGTEQRQRGYNDLSLRMGTALEPMVVKWLADQGVLCYFTGADQLEVALADSDPNKLGHLDGIIGIDGEPSWWVRHNFPARALQILTGDGLTSGNCMMLEVKTMNDDAFEKFLREGLAGGVFTQQYEGQSNSYLKALSDPAYDEEWPDHEVVDEDGTVRMVLGSTSFKVLLRAKQWKRPTSALLVAFNPGQKRFAFEVLDFDPDRYEKRNAELSEIGPYLRNGELPPPDYDGQSAQCYFCYYAYTCPAVQALAASRVIDDIPILLEDNVKEVEEIAAAYHGINSEIKMLEARKKELRDDLERRVGAARIVTPGYLVTLSEVKGRRGLDTDQVRKDYEAIGKPVPYKTGNPYSRLHITPLYGPSARDDAD